MYTRLSKKRLIFLSILTAFLLVALAYTSMLLNIHHAIVLFGVLIVVTPFALLAAGLYSLFCYAFYKSIFNPNKARWVRITLSVLLSASALYLVAFSLYNLFHPDSKLLAAKENIPAAEACFIENRTLYEQEILALNEGAALSNDKYYSYTTSDGRYYFKYSTLYHSHGRTFTDFYFIYDPTGTTRPGFFKKYGCKPHGYIHKLDDNWYLEICVTYAPS